MPAKKPTVHFIEIAEDSSLLILENKVNKAARHVDPHCGQVKLYRTSDGRIGFSIEKLNVTPGNKKALDSLYRAIVGTLGIRKGRPLKPEPRVQANLRLSKTVYARLKDATADSHQSMSDIAEEAIRQYFAQEQTS